VRSAIQQVTKSSINKSIRHHRFARSPDHHWTATERCCDSRGVQAFGVVVLTGGLVSVKHRRANGAAGQGAVALSTGNNL